MIKLSENSVPGTNRSPAFSPEPRYECGGVDPSMRTFELKMALLHAVKTFLTVVDPTMRTFELKMALLHAMKAF